jgi:hypothetical protein
MDFIFKAGLVQGYYEVSLLGGLVVLMPGHRWSYGTARLAGGRFIFDWEHYLPTRRK